MGLALQDCTALLIDPNLTTRSILCAQLRDLGVKAVTQTGRTGEARRLLETLSYDLVLCELDFPEDGCSTQNGQELLDELRQAQRLPWSTVFVMISGERRYAKVAEAAEGAMDSFLLKPFTSAALQDRLLAARHRKQQLDSIYSAVDAGRFDEAIGLCQARCAAKASLWRLAARMGTELMLRLGQTAAARSWLDALQAEEPAAWVRLGLARAQLAQAQPGQALRTLEALRQQEPGQVEALDLMVRTQLAQGQLAAALASCRQAAQLTPNALRRQQKLGLLAFYAGEEASARQALDRAIVLGSHSRMFDEQCLALAALLHHRAKDSKGLARCLHDLRRAEALRPADTRLARQRALVETVSQLHRRELAQAVLSVRAQMAQLRAPDLDVVSACNLLSVLAQLSAVEVQLPETEEWVQTLALRFAGHKTVVELLAGAAWPCPPHQALVRQAHARVNEVAQQALTHSLQGQPAQALQTLLDAARRSLNPKLLDTARGVLGRYAGSLGELQAWQELLEQVQRLAGTPSTDLAGLGMDDSDLDGLRMRRTPAPVTV
jgi:DNA-binding response OmpR family regulator